jgi:hypothetical protein
VTAGGDRFHLRLGSSAGPWAAADGQPAVEDREILMPAPLLAERLGQCRTQGDGAPWAQEIGSELSLHLLDFLDQSVLHDGRLFRIVREILHPAEGMDRLR